MNKWRRSQVVRQGTANPLYEGSIPSGASKSFAGVVKLADTLALGASAERHAGPNPAPGIRTRPWFSGRTYPCQG